MVGLEKGPGAYLEHDVYQVEGSGDDTCSSTAESLILEMTKTIADMEEDDVVIVSFDISIHADQNIAQPPIAFRLYADTTLLGPELKHEFHDFSIGSKGVVSMTRYYLVPSNGDYTFTAKWQAPSGGGTRVVCNDGMRCMVIQHFH